MFSHIAHKLGDHTLTMYPFLKKYRSPLIEVAASNTRLRLHCSSLGLGRSGFGSSVGSSGSGSGGGLGFGAVVGSAVRLPERLEKSKVTHECLQSSVFNHHRANVYHSN